MLCLQAVAKSFGFTVPPRVNLALESKSSHARKAAKLMAQVGGGKGHRKGTEGALQGHLAWCACVCLRASRSWPRWAAACSMPDEPEGMGPDPAHPKIAKVFKFN